MACDAFENMLHFTLHDFEKIDANATGVYGFWYDKHCIYVGKAADQPIRNRLLQHWHESHNPTLIRWIAAKKTALNLAIKTLDDAHDIDIMERYCIYRYQPSANKIKPKTQPVVPSQCA